MARDGEDSLRSERLARLMRAEEERGIRLSIWGRVVALGLIGVLLLVVVEWPEVLYFHGLLLLFIVVGLVQVRTARQSWARPWSAYVFAAVDMALLTWVLLAPNPLSPWTTAEQLAIQINNSVYIYTLLAGLAFSLRPKLVLWGALMAALFWSLGMGWVTTVDGVESLGIGEVWPQEQTSSVRVDWELVLQDVALFVIVGVMLSMGVMRVRRIVYRQALLEGERANLAQYFPPALVERLSAKGPAPFETREQPVVVLFADIVGFTSQAEGQSPTEIITLLREVHSRLQAQVFAHGGTLDNFLGDGIMATFGNPDPAPDDAARAVQCALAVLAEMAAWNQRREAAGQAPLQLSLGLHRGPVVIGDIGTKQRLVLAVVGDTVNVASRLESASRALEVSAVISEAVIDAARAGGLECAGVEALRCHPQPLSLKGRREPVTVWVASAPTAAAAARAGVEQTQGRDGADDRVALSVAGT